MATSRPERQLHAGAGDGECSPAQFL